MWSLRGSPTIFPTSDAALFTLGLLPEDEESLRFFILGSVPALDRVGMSATEAIERTRVELYDALDGRQMTLTELGVDLAQRVSKHLPRSSLPPGSRPPGTRPRNVLARLSFTSPSMSTRCRDCSALRRGEVTRLLSYARISGLGHRCRLHPTSRLALIFYAAT